MVVDKYSRQRPWPDEAHEDIARYVDATTVGVDDLATAMQALAMLANTFFAALDSSLADRQSLHTEDTRLAGLIGTEATRATTAEAALSARIAALETRTLVGTTGQLTKNLTLGVGGSTTAYDVTFAKAMPSTSYVPLVTLDSSSVSLLGSVSVVYPITNKTTTGCTVTVRNTAVVTLASSVTVQVAALQLA